jgi:hypothetical protein
VFIVDFDENKSQSHNQNIAKNRKTLILLFVMFITPVALAYAAYFGNWFSGASGAQGQLIESDKLIDIEDYDFYKDGDQIITGKEFETLYWWILPLDTERCDQACANVNLHTVNQTYLGLGKEASRINQLVVVPKDNRIDLGTFPMATSDFNSKGVMPREKTHSGKSLELESNFIYLVDPLGNIFMRYPLVEQEKDAALMSRKLRKDILHLFKYSRLG